MRLLLNTEAYPDYTQDQLVEWLGVLPHWVAEYAVVEDGDLVEHMTDCYGFGSLYKFKGKVLDNGTYTYPEDKELVCYYSTSNLNQAREQVKVYHDDLEPIAKVKLKKGDVYFYPYAMIALPTKDGHYVTRMD